MKNWVLDVIKWVVIIIVAGLVLYFLASKFKGQTIVVLSMLLTALATIIIAIYAVVNYRLSSKFQSMNEAYRQQIRDHFEATVIANIVGGPHETNKAVRAFKEHYIR